MASIKLYLDTRAPRKDGTYPLKLLVTHKQPFMISLKIYLQEDQWLGNEVINHKEKKAFNIFIQQRFITIKKLLLTLEGEGKLKSLSPKQLKEKIENINSFENTESENISYLFKNHMEKCIGEKTNPRTRELYQYTLNKIKEFADIDKLTFEDMDLAWMKSFDRFMSDTCGVNARSIHFRNIRSVFNDAIDEEAISQNVYPFRKFKIKKRSNAKTLFGCR
ncbi:MAG: phage integrase SAM-like domain and Arm DNA-binding domain-containing protein [Dysgonomonas sp.]